MEQEFITKLKLFKKQVEKLRSDQDFFKNLGYSLKYEQGKGIRTGFTNRPDDKSIKALLIDLRPFLLKGEQVNFYRICNLLFQKVTDRQVKEKVKKAREAWSILLERKRKGPIGGIRLKIGEKDILSEENLNTWLYGEYFHLEQDKMKILEQMNLTPMGGLSFLLFLDLLQRLSALVFYLEKQVIDEVLTENL
jgi:hypothetical protein